MSQQDLPRRTSGAPAWAVLLGLGTAEESAARPQAVKWAARLFGTVLFTAVFVAYFAVREGTGAVSAGAVALWALVAALLVASWSIGSAYYLRRTYSGGESSSRA